MSQTTNGVPPPPNWALELNSPPVPRTKIAGIPDPPGFTAAASGNRKAIAASKQTARTPPTTAEMDTLKIKKAWEVALAPIKQLPMTGVMMYMSGNSLQIFSIMMVVMAFKNPILGLMATNTAFQRFETEGTKQQLATVKAAYVACQFVALALGVWKVDKMGLLPTTRSDWLAWESAREPLEFATPAL